MGAHLHINYKLRLQTLRIKFMEKVEMIVAVILSLAMVFAQSEG